MDEVSIYAEGYDKEVYEMKDLLLSCKTEADAKNYIDYCFNPLTTAEKETVIKSFFGIKNKNLRKPAPAFLQSGGNDDADIRVYRLMELADLCHDFFDARYDDDDKVRTFMEDNGYILPVNMSIRTLRNEKLFIRYVSNNPTLTFLTDPKTVDNPLHGADILKHFKIDGKYPSFEALYEAQQRSISGAIGNRKNRMCSVDVWTELDYFGQQHRKDPVQIIKINQIAQLCCTIRRWLGNDCDFQVDSADSHLVLLICATNNLSKQFYKKFRTEPDTRLTRDISAKLLKVIQDLDDSFKTTWKTRATDANLFDAAQNTSKLPFDTRPTGDVFRKECGYQIELKGIIKKSVVVAITDTESESVELTLKNHETTEILSKSVIKLLAGLQPPAKVRNIRDQILMFSDPLKYALKRAGDWGQVEHCVRYGKVFVTSDKLAALYAYFRNVRFIYLNRDEHFNFDVVTGADDVDPLSHMPNFFRYSFVISRVMGNPKHTLDRKN